MNAPYVLNEIALALETLASTGQCRTLFLSQFPMTEEDATYIQQFLGPGKMMIQSGGLSPTVWRETGVAGVWWGEYYNPERKVMLRTIEIAKVPELAVAPVEDIQLGLAGMRERLHSSLPEFEATGDPSCMKPQ